MQKYFLVLFVLAVLLPDPGFSSPAQTRKRHCTAPGHFICIEVKPRSVSPVEPGKTATRKHPRYKTLLKTAETLGVTVKWKTNLARMAGVPIRDGEELEGYFDSETNAVYLDSKIASLNTLVHELRHALHLGTAHPITGQKFDREVQLANRVGLKFDEQLNTRSDLSEERKAELIDFKDEVVVTASEISAHYHDLLISIRRRAVSPTRDSLVFRKQYRRDFILAYKKIKSAPELENLEFLDRLYAATLEYFDYTNQLIKPKIGFLKKKESASDQNGFESHEHAY
ncbi:MAG: hypothetical protein AB1540_06070 [Bdellovibrionota bacterium]